MTRGVKRDFCVQNDRKKKVRNLKNLRFMFSSAGFFESLEKLRIIVYNYLKAFLPANDYRLRKSYQ